MKKSTTHYDHIYYLNTIDNDDELLSHLDKYYEAHDDYPDENGKTTLHYVMYHCAFNIIVFLIEKKNVNINLIDDIGNTPLHYAVFREDYPAILKYFVKKGAKVNVKNIFDETPYSLRKIIKNIKKEYY